MKNFVFYLLGFFISSLGIVFFVKANVGVGTGDSFAIGLSLHLPISIGVGFILIHTLIVFINSTLSKHRPKINIVFPILLRGLTVDICLFLLGSLHVENLLIRWLLLLFGIVLMGIGLGLYLQTTLPKIPVDEFMFTLSKINHLSFRLNRILFESTLMLLGFLLGGPIGLGTLFIAIGLGPSIQFWNEKFQNNSKKMFLTS